MNDQDYSTESAVPPLTGEVEAPSTRWPSVIGTISIILAALGLLVYACGSLNVVLGPMMSGLVPPDQRPPKPPLMMVAIQTIQSCVAWLLSLWLLIAGINLLNRRRTGRTRHVAWAFAKIIISAISTALGFAMMNQTVQQMNEQFTKSKFKFTMTNHIMTIIVIGMLILILIYPVFVIVWFGRKKIIAEVEQWR